ncbi:septum formation family protein [Jidongwangia harbinensis]|uniref:septum formation family protein n=1 Tax=Jidongwangia harbinensis TaxID=2878561 RepID=UPI001CD91E9A|nr:septum formation family protein [Jidongwangia harbinensis]MCA2215891.1 septum formation family protein [Jidongwangia harbinensis]
MRLRLRTRLGISAMSIALVLLAGCGNPRGVDGDLTNDWTPIAAPTGFVPETGTCHLANFAAAGPRGTYEEIDCKLKHRTETVYVGRYPDPAAEADAPPADGSAGAREAYRTCDQKTTAYVGGQWRTARLWVGVTRPTAAAWTGGARWFRCEVLEISTIEDDGGLVMRVGSLRDALRDRTSPLRLACYAIEMDAAGAITTMPATPCAAGHNAEFVGIWYADDLPYPTQDKEWGPFHAGCRNLIAAYVDVPNDADLQFRTGVVSLPGGADVWALGDRGVRCYLWVDAATLTSSLKGKGVQALPVQFK